MCGIFGLVDGRQAVDIKLAEQASRILRHRGPDDEGFLFADWRSGATYSVGGPDSRRSLNLPSLGTAEGRAFNVVLANRRLAILDLSDAGHQPMGSPDGRRWLTYNGEIYNFVELRSELTTLGYTFQTQTDTEVMLAAYDAWGTNAVNHFIGMFAFALLDLHSRTLVLARDPFGIKPLYYALTPTGIAFASEIPPLLEAPGISRRANPSRVYDYLVRRQTDHGQETMFADVRQLAAAHCMTIDLDGHTDARPRRYWSLEPGATSSASLTSAAGELRGLFTDSVRMHLRSDVPVGACLSGGVDSSSIVATMRAVGGPSLDLRTFSYIADDAKLNEASWAAIAAAAASSSARIVRTSSMELSRDIDRLIRVQGEPFAGTSIYAQYRLFESARADGTKVMLDGQGADELFLGYEYFWNARVATLLARASVLSMLRVARLASPSAQQFARVLLHGAALLTPVRMRRPMFAVSGRQLEPKWLDRKWLRRQGVTPGVPKWPAADRLRSEGRRALFDTSLPALLRYEDRNSMAWSIESRVPFLTTQLAQFVAELPDEFLLSNDGTSKAVLRRAMRGLVPDPILDRRDKIAFATPQTTWLRELQPQIQASLCGTLLERVRVLDRQTVRAQLARDFEHDSARAAVVWTWFNLVKWAEAFSVDFPD